jgi:hypothetical protein
VLGVHPSSVVLDRFRAENVEVDVQTGGGSFDQLMP